MTHGSIFLKPWTGCSLEQLSPVGFEEIRRNSILLLQSYMASVNSARKKQSRPCATCVRTDNREDAGIVTLKSMTAGISCTPLRGLIIEKGTDNTVDGIQHYGFTVQRPQEDNRVPGWIIQPM